MKSTTPRYDWLYFKPGVTLMGKTKLRFLAIVSSLLFAPVGMGQSGNPPTGSDDAIAQVKTLQKQLTQAILKADTGFLQKCYADDYTAIHGDGKLTTKTEEIANFDSGITKYESIEVRDSKARAYGDTVIVNARALVKTTVNGKPYAGEVSNTRVWVRQNGEWKLASFQTTRVAQSSQ
jgi:ketosteroid isomerase-like protein